MLVSQAFRIDSYPAPRRAAAHLEWLSSRPAGLNGVGARIVAETFHRAMEGSRASIVRDSSWRPTLGPDNKTFRMVDLLLFAFEGKKKLLAHRSDSQSRAPVLTRVAPSCGARLTVSRMRARPRARSEEAGEATGRRPYAGRTAGARHRER